MFCLAVIHFEQSLSGNPSKQLFCSEAFWYQTQNLRQVSLIKLLKDTYEIPVSDKDGYSASWIREN